MSWAAKRGVVVGYVAGSWDLNLEGPDFSSAPDSDRRLLETHTEVLFTGAVAQRGPHFGLRVCSGICEAKQKASYTKRSG